MKYLKELKDGGRIQDVYLCKHKQAMTTKNGKAYDSLVLQDRTGTMDAKIWDPNSDGISDFDELDYIYVSGGVSTFNGQLQANLRQVRKAQEGEYIPADYLPVTKKNTRMLYSELMNFVESVKNPYLQALLKSFFEEDQEFMKSFVKHSAAKTVHHGFVGGLLEHTVSVTKFADFEAQMYPNINRDLLITAALLHDIGKTKELSLFPKNEYTDDGQMLGHIVIGAEMIHDHAAKIENFPELLETELEHCILAHHGEYEYGSPKKPVLIEALALNLADNMDAKLESMTEILENGNAGDKWLGFNRFFDSNIRRTEEE